MTEAVTGTSTGTSTGTTAPARPRRRPVVGLLAVVVLLVLVVVGALVWRQLAGDDGAPEAPYTDASATGRLTLCDADGAAVASGSTTDQPFATTVVAPTAATGGYDVDGKAAVLFAYQPRPGVGSDEWSGLQLTAPTAYDDASRPTATVSAQATTLGQFLAGYPAVADGFVQLRVVLGAPGASASPTYDSLDLHIDGDRWEAVDVGDPAACR